MPYGDDITEGLPYVLSNASVNPTYTATGESYDISLNGLPFFLAAIDEFPYTRQTAPYRKQQIDQTNEPGEQTLTGWWTRSQSSFHNGTGIKFYDPSAGESVAYRVNDCKGVNVWTKGEVTLLNDSTEEHVTTGAIASNGRPFQFSRSIQWSTSKGILLLDEYDVDKIAANGTVTHYIDYNAGAGVYPVYAICDDGTYAYWVTNVTSGGSAKLTVYKKPLTGSSASTADETKIYEANFTISNAVMEFTKERIVMCADNKVYELSTSPGTTTLPTPVYTHPASSHVFTSITASGPAIYVSGYNGIQSTIIKFTLTTTGGMPTLSAGAAVAAELPVGEWVFRIYYYLGYMMIGTNKGVRAAIVSDQDGSINYGPLIIEGTQPCYDFAARDRFIWCATSVDGEPGVTRIDLSTEVESLRFAYANDVYNATGSTVHPTTSCAFIGDTDIISFTSAYASAAEGGVYLENESSLVPSGYITTGKIRYSTLEAKVFKLLKIRMNNGFGGVSIQSIDTLGQAYNIGSFAEGDILSEIGVSYPYSSQEFMSFKFTFTRFSTDASKGPVFNGYQLKALPAVPRQRLIQYPLYCYDNETDKFGVTIGYEGSAYDKLSDLEALENVGDSIRVEDFRTGESYIGLIEEIQFINRTPTDKRFSGFGGTLVVAIRTL